MTTTPHTAEALVLLLELKYPNGELVELTEAQQLEAAELIKTLVQEIERLKEQRNTYCNEALRLSAMQPKAGITPRNGAAISMTWLGSRMKGQ